MPLKQEPDEPPATAAPVISKLQSQRQSSTPRHLNNTALISNKSYRPHPLLLFLVMWNVLNYLDLEALKNSRLVCKLWNEVGTSFLPQRSEVRLYCARITKKVKAKSKSMTQFSKFLKKPSNPEQGSLFKTTNLAISRFGHGIRYCVCNNGRIGGTTSPPSPSCPTCVVFSRCRNTLKTLSLHSVPWPMFLLAMKTAFINFPCLESLKIVYENRGAISSDDREIAPDLTLPDDQPIRHRLQYFHLENFTSLWEHSDIGRIIDFKVFWKMTPNITDITLKDSHNALAIILESLTPYSKQLPLSKLNIIALKEEGASQTLPQERQKLAEELRKVVTNPHLKELILEINLSLLQWSLVIDGNLPPTIHRLRIISNFCMGLRYERENPHGQLYENDSANRIFGILGATVPDSLHELAFCFIAPPFIEPPSGRRLFHLPQPTTLNFESVRDLSWVCRCVKSCRVNWERFFPTGFQEIATVFPNLRRLEATITKTKTLRQLCAIFPLLEGLIISNYSKMKLSDSDILGDSLKVTNSGKKQNENVGLVGLKKLKSLTIESDCKKLTDVSLNHGFLKMPELKELHISDGPEFGPEEMQALFAKNFARLSIQHK